MCSSYNGSHGLLLFLLFSFLIGFIGSTSIGKQCETSSECQSEDTYSICRNNSCECIHKSFDNDEFKYCKALVGDNCTWRTSQQLLPKYSECAKNVVKCLPGYYTEHLLCNKGNTSIGEKCSATEQCEDPNAECTKSICNCTYGIITVNGTDYCVQGPRNWTCSVSETCFKNSECVDEQCMCKLGYSMLTRRGCIKNKKTNLEEYCVENSDCNATSSICDYGQCNCNYTSGDYHIITTPGGLKECSSNVSLFNACTKYDLVVTDGAECVNNTVVCKSGYRTIDFFCIEEKPIPLDEPCSANFQCQYLYNNTRCFFGKCHCDKGFYPNDEPGHPKCVFPVDLFDACDNVTYICDFGTGYACIDGNCTCTPGYHLVNQYNCGKDKNPDTHKSKSGSNTVAIACGVTGGVVAVVIIAALIAVYVRKSENTHRRIT